MSPSPNPTNDLIELPPWGRDERDTPAEDCATIVRRLVLVIRILVALNRD